MFHASHWTRRSQPRGAGPLVVALAAALAAGVAAQPPGSQPASSAILITGARVLDVVPGRYIAPAAVLIENGRIASVTAREPSALPPGAQRLSLTNATLVPGLIDARASVTPTRGYDSDHLQSLGLAHGVTAYRVLNMRTTWAVAQRRRIEEGAVRAPKLWIGGRGFDRGARQDLRLLDVPDARWIAAEAARQVADNVDWLAGFDGLTPELHRALVTAVKGTAVRVAGMPGVSSMADLAAAGVHSIDGLAWPVSGRRPGADAAAADRAWAEAPQRDLNALALRLVRARVFLVPMLAQQDGPPDAPRASSTVNARRARAAQRAFLARFVRAGGRVVTGSGFDVAGYPLPGAGVHAEMAALVRAGLAPADAIRAATVNGAAMLGAERARGRIAAGYEADLFVVEGDPLSDVGDLLKPTHVIRRGEVLPTQS